MVTLVISISSDVLVESVGSSFLRVILIGSILVEVPVTPEDDPSKSSLPLVSVAPMVTPFLCSDDSESDIEIPKRQVSPIPHEAMLTRWRSRVALRSSSPTTFISKIPTATILLAPSTIVALSFEFPLAPVVSPTRIPLRYTSHHLDHFTSGSSSSHSSSNHSSSGHSITVHSLSGHTPPDTIDVDSSTPPRFIHPSLARTSWCSKAYLLPSRADLLPHRRRFRDSISLEDSVKEDIETDVLEDVEADATTVEVAVDRDVEAGIDACIGIEVDVGVDVEDEVEGEVESSDKGTMEVGVDVVAKIDIPDGMLMPDAVEHLEQVEEGLQDIYDHVIEIPLQRIEDIKTGHRELEARILIVGGERERASLLEQVASLERSNARL
uniref:Uncharacterized protein n=1 Tax=Tanacetum cinerariifolium TaxID=118510 RepID=A0A6L2JBJ9_TANCI|nr:hypothetical protein [Tanacetum cinerariifolium]